MRTLERTLTIYVRHRQTHSVNVFKHLISVSVFEMPQWTFSYIFFILNGDVSVITRQRVFSVVSLIRISYRALVLFLFCFFPRTILLHNYLRKQNSLLKHAKLMYMLTKLAISKNNYSVTLGQWPGPKFWVFRGRIYEECEYRFGLVRATRTDPYSPKKLPIREYNSWFRVVLTNLIPDSESTPNFGSSRVFSGVLGYLWAEIWALGAV